MILDADPLAVLTGELEHRPELPILLALLDEAVEQAGAPVLRRWVRRVGPAGRPLDLLVARDFTGFEAALGTLAERGFVLRGGGRGGGRESGASSGGGRHGSGGPGSGPPPPSSPG